MAVPVCHGCSVDSQGDPTKVVGRRCLQAALDRALELTASLIIAISTGFALVQFGGASRRFVAVVGVSVYLAGLIAASLLNEVVLPSRRGNATLGMAVTGLRVLTLDGSAPRLRSFFLRWLLWQADGLFFGLVGLIIMQFTPRHQRLGDLVASTVVVRRSSVDQPVLPCPDRQLGAVS
jgi:uncharacterized RDD family membrane protein YckC